MLRDNMEAIGWSCRGFGGMGSLRKKKKYWESIFFILLIVSDCR